MTSANTNPFVFPGFGQPGDLAQNPMMASMEMMRQAWQSLAGAGAGGMPSGGIMAPPMSLEELDRRISEMRSVENWLRMNLSMLSSTIQGMEVQRATIATIKSFVSPVAEGNHEAPSALEVALGLKPSGQAKIKPASETGAAKAAPAANASASVFSGMAGAPEAMVGSADAWWGMLQQQFDTLASATAASMKSAEDAVAAAGKAAEAAAAGPVATSTSVSSGLGAVGKGAASSSKKAAASAGSAGATKAAKSASSAPRKRAASPKASS